MDYVVGDDNVSNLLAEQYELLYNSVKYKMMNLTSLFMIKHVIFIKDTRMTITRHSQSHTHAITVEHV